MFPLFIFTFSFVSHESLSFLEKIPEAFVFARSYMHFECIFRVLLLVALDFPFGHYP